MPTAPWSLRCLMHGFSARLTRTAQLLSLALASAALAFPQSGPLFDGYFQGSNIYISTPYYPNRLDSQHTNAASRMTYLMYAFADVVNTTQQNGTVTSACQLHDKWAEIQKPFDQTSMAVMGQTDSDANSNVTLEGLFHQFQLLKQYNPNLKILISIGGAAASSQFQIAASPANVQGFVNSCTDLFMNGNFGLSQKYPGVFDGIDVDWEFPGPTKSGTNATTDQQNYISLLQAFRTAFGSNGILTSATGVSLNQYQVSTNQQLQAFLSQASASLNYFNVMTYDFNYAGSTGSMLRSSPHPPGWRTVEATMIRCLRTT